MTQLATFPKTTLAVIVNPRYVRYWLFLSVFDKSIYYFSLSPIPPKFSVLSPKKKINIKKKRYREKLSLTS